MNLRDRASTPIQSRSVGQSAGGGNVLNVQRTIKQLIASGAKGCFIEDKEWPKRPSAGNIRTDPVIAMEEV